VRLCHLVLAGLLLVASSSVAQQRPQCTEQGWYRRTCDRAWDFAIAGNKAGDVFYGCAAHTYNVYGGDGAMYSILDQCHEGQGCTGESGTYPRPADGLAAAVWDSYYKAPDAQARRERFGYFNPSFKIPQGVQRYTFFDLFGVTPLAQQATISRSYGCSGAPVGTPTPFRDTRTPTARRTLTGPPSPGGCPGGVPCTRLTPTVKPSTFPTRTNTAVRPTPVPVQTVPPPSTRVPSMPPSRVTLTAIPPASSSPTPIDPTSPTTTPGPGSSIGLVAILSGAALAAVAGIVKAFRWTVAKVKSMFTEGRR
jgi:hypothetical protein